MSLWNVAEEEHARIIRFILFQSLFSWMSLWNSKVAGCAGARMRFQSLFRGFAWNTSLPVSHQVGCFISCFPGRRSGTASAFELSGLFPVVSILVFVDVALERHMDEQIHPSFRFQSLFSWMSLWNETDFLSMLERMGFQSLFSWMSLWNYHATQEHLCCM